MWDAPSPFYLETSAPLRSLFQEPAGFIHASSPGQKQRGAVWCMGRVTENLPHRCALASVSCALQTTDAPANPWLGERPQGALRVRAGCTDREAPGTTARPSRPEHRLGWAGTPELTLEAPSFTPTMKICHFYSSQQYISSNQELSIANCGVGNFLVRDFILARCVAQVNSFAAIREIKQ